MVTFTPLADVADFLAGMGVADLRAQIDRYIVQRGPELLGNLVAALIIFVVGRWIARMLGRLVGQTLDRSRIDQTLSKFLTRIAYALAMAAVVMAALDRIGVNTTSLAAVLAAAGLAIGMALQGSLSNFAAGVMLILFRPFKVGDFVEAAGTKGTVEEIHLFSTMMRTGDNAQVIVPNSAITSSNITNFSAKETRRIDLVVGCGYEDDLQAVKRLLMQLVQEEPCVLRDPEPVVAVADLAESSVNFVVRPWVASGDYWKVRWSLTEKIKTRFDQHGFHIPYPQRDIHVYSTGSGEQQHPSDPVRKRGRVQPRRVA